MSPFILKAQWQTRECYLQVLDAPAAAAAAAENFLDAWWQTLTKHEERLPTTWTDAITLDQQYLWVCVFVHSFDRVTNKEFHIVPRRLFRILSSNPIFYTLAKAFGFLNLLSHR